MPARARAPVAGALRMANSQRLADPVGQMLDKVCVVRSLCCDRPENLTLKEARSMKLSAVSLFSYPYQCMYVH